jgi:hypothetical protein
MDIIPVCKTPVIQVLLRGPNIHPMFLTPGVICQGGQACLQLEIGRIDMR